MSTTLQLYDRARAAIAARGFDPEVQTRIALFVGAAKCVNAAILAAVELQPQVSVVYPFVHGQYFREVEFATMLVRVTHWSPDWSIYSQGAALTLPLWAQWWQIQMPPGPYCLNLRGVPSSFGVPLVKANRRPLVSDSGQSWPVRFTNSGL